MYEHDVPLVKCWREHLGMTQAELAQASGVQQSAIERIEPSIDYTTQNHA
ncbi:helix-turn-helix transcriptional regulator [Thiomicrospira cyclica]|nr:helix-turn-helix transcriptional regulator [Thiomicrospira cyclica]